jgi:clavulanate-9-aldehyde reducatase
MGQLDNRKILVTGGSSGIGEATAKAIVAEGGSVALGARRKERLDEIVDGLADNGSKAVAIEADVSDEEQARKLVEEASEELDGLDGLVNNAGVMLLGPVFDADTDNWRTMLDVNLLGLLLCTHAALPVMKEGGGGDIVNVSSVAGRFANKGSAVYNMTKFGVTAFSEALRQEVLEMNVRITCVEPGFVATELQSHNEGEPEKMIEEMRDDIGTVLESEDIANAIVYALAQPEHVSINEILVRPTNQAR